MFWKVAGSPVYSVLRAPFSLIPTLPTISTLSFPQLRCLANALCRPLSPQTGSLAPHLRPLESFRIMRCFLKSYSLI